MITLDLSANTFTPISVNRLGYALKRLCDLRGMTQIQLGERIGISAPAVSNIINGNSKPRPITLTKLIHVLCHTRDEYQNLIACYEGGADKLKEIPEFLEWKPSEEEELERACRYLNVKANSIRFENAVADTLESAGVQFQRDVLKEDFVNDFIVDGPSETIAVECKYNVNRDWDRTSTTVRLLLKQLPYDKVVVAIPYVNELPRNARSEIQEVGGSVMDVKNLIAYFEDMSKGKR